MVYNHVSLGKNLKRIRKIRNLTIKQLSEQIGSSESALRSVESGHRYFSIQRLCSVANTFNISLDELLVDSPEDMRIFSEQRSSYQASPYFELISRLDDCEDKEVVFLLEILRSLEKFKIVNDITGNIPDTDQDQM